MATLIVIAKKKPVNIDRYLRALAETILLFKIAFDIIHLLSGWVI
jgi:hypothetical protein